MYALLMKLLLFAPVSCEGCTSIFLQSLRREICFVIGAVSRTIRSPDLMMGFAQGYSRGNQVQQQLIAGSKSIIYSDAVSAEYISTSFPYIYTESREKPVWVGIYIRAAIRQPIATMLHRIDSAAAPVIRVICPARDSMGTCAAVGQQRKPWVSIESSPIIRTPHMAMRVQLTR